MATETERLDLVEIEWLDAYASGQGFSLETWREKIREHRQLHHVVGYLVYRDDQVVAVAQNVGPDLVSDLFVIPLGMVTGMTIHSTGYLVETKAASRDDVEIGALGRDVAYPLGKESR